MPRHFFLCAAFGAALLVGAAPSSASPKSSHEIVITRRDDVLVRSSPSPYGRVLARLVQQTQVEVLGKRKEWLHISLWASVQGWVLADAMAHARPWPTVSTYQAPTIRYPVQAHPALPLRILARGTEPLTMRTTPNGAVVGAVPAGTNLTVTAWQQDTSGKIWYQVRGRWVLGDAVQFSVSSSQLHVRSAWQRVAGKGMWLTLGPINANSASAIVQAAVSNGMTHLYLESAISPLGFHGRSLVGPLIEAAHQHHLAVIAWVYPYLYDIAADVALTRTVAAFRTQHGEHFDGIAADLERNISSWDVRAYSQIVRAYLGNRYLLVGVTYPPQSFPNYPFADVARDYNLIAPMDYWHQTKTSYPLGSAGIPYGWSYTYNYALESIQRIHQAAGNVPVSPIGQTFDDFGRLGMGPYAPSAPEVSGFLAGTKHGGGIGASFFQWMTTQVGVWHAIRAFRF